MRQWSCGRLLSSGVRPNVGSYFFFSTDEDSAWILKLQCHRFTRGGNLLHFVFVG